MQTANIVEVWSMMSKHPLVCSVSQKAKEQHLRNNFSELFTFQCLSLTLLFPTQKLSSYDLLI